MKSTSSASLWQAGVVIPISINQLAWSTCWSRCHTDVFGCLGDCNIAKKALPHRVFDAHAIFLLLLTLHKSFIMQQFSIIYYYYYLRFALFFVHRKTIRVGQCCHLGVLTYYVISAGWGASSTLRYPTWGLRHHWASSTSLSVRHTGHISLIIYFA